MKQIGIEKDGDIQEYTKLLWKFFPKINIYVGFCEPLDSDPEMTCIVDANAGLFKNTLTINGLKADNDIEKTKIILKLAKKISSEWQTRTLCDAKGTVDSDLTETLILWDNGKSYLADGEDVLNHGGGLKIISEIVLASVQDFIQ